MIQFLRSKGLLHAHNIRKLHQPPAAADVNVADGVGSRACGRLHLKDYIILLGPALEICDSTAAEKGLQRSADVCH